jgi:hypothetical protein
MVVDEATLLLLGDALPGLFVDLGKEVDVEDARGDEEDDEGLGELAWHYS